MLKYLLRRITLLILTLFLILFIAYLIIYIADINPYSKSSSNHEEALNLYNISNLNKPFFVRFGNWFSAIFKLDFGKIYSSEFQLSNTNNIAQLFLEPFGYTLALVIPALLVGFILGISLGSYAAFRVNKWQDYLINIFVYLFVAMPIFILAPLFIILSSTLKIPSTFIPVSLSNNYGITILSTLLPFLLLVLSSLSLFTYYAREEVIELKKSEYILFLKALGLNKKQIFFKNILRNILVPLLKQATTTFLVLLSESLIIQSFFNYPGNAQLLEKAFQNGEVNILMFNILFYSLLSLALSFILDILIIYIRPDANYLVEKQRIRFLKKVYAFSKRKLNINSKKG